MLFGLGLLWSRGSLEKSLDGSGDEQEEPVLPPLNHLLVFVPPCLWFSFLGEVYFLSNVSVAVLHLVSQSSYQTDNEHTIKKKRIPPLLSCETALDGDARVLVTQLGDKGHVNLAAKGQIQQPQMAALLHNLHDSRRLDAAATKQVQLLKQRRTICQLVQAMVCRRTVGRQKQLAESRAACWI